MRAIDLTVTMNAPWTTYGNAIVDPCNLKIPVGKTLGVSADSIVLAARTIGTTRILLKTAAEGNPVIANPRIASASSCIPPRR